MRRGRRGQNAVITRPGDRGARVFDPINLVMKFSGHLRRMLEAVARVRLAARLALLRD